MQDISAAAISFESAGFVLLRDNVWGRLLNCDSIVRPAAFDDGNGVGNVTVAPLAIVGNERLFAEVILSPNLLRVLRRLLGVNPVLDSVVIHRTNSGDESPCIVEWHRDRFSGCPSGTYERPGLIVAIWYLYDMADINGPLMVIPGSHIVPIYLEKSDLQAIQQGQFALYTKVGDVVLLHNRIIHSASKKDAASNRVFLGATYVSPWTIRQMSYPDESIGKLLPLFQGPEELLKGAFMSAEAASMTYNSGFVTVSEE